MPASSGECGLIGVIGAVSWITPLVAREQHPTSGLVHNTVEANSLIYQCDQKDAGILECSFVQTSVRRKADPAKLQEKLDKARAEFAQKKSNLSKQECDLAQVMETALSTGVAPPEADPKVFAQKFREMTPTEKKDFVQSFKTMNAFRREPVEARYLDMIRFFHQRDTRTCLASSNLFIQRFQRVAGSDSWVVTGTPTGPCGTVNVSRFEKDKSVGLDFWRYYSKKVITNPQGEFLPGASCSKLDQDEYFYNWRSKDWQLGCDYIEFSPI